MMYVGCRMKRTVTEQAYLEVDLWNQHLCLQGFEMWRFFNYNFGLIGLKLS